MAAVSKTEIAVFFMPNFKNLSVCVDTEKLKIYNKLYIVNIGGTRNEIYR